jgi:hypothetical protein
MGVLVYGLDGSAAHNCTCRAGGTDYAQGEVRCIMGKLSRCDMNQNNSSWKVIAETCPEASLPATSGALLSRLLPRSLSLPHC